MSEVLRQAVVDAHASEAQAAQFAQMLALVQAMQQVPQTSGCRCAHEAPKDPRRSAGSMIATAGAVCVCGAVLTALFLAVALVAVAVSVGALVVVWLVREVKSQNDRR